MLISQKFDQQSWAPQLARRQKNFKRMIEHLEVLTGGIIVETGTAWDQGNFNGQGQSTIIWDWFAEEHGVFEVHSCDIRQEAIDTASKQTRHVTYHLGDSIKTLNEMDPVFVGGIKLLYLDSFDWTPEGNIDSAFHHIAELAGVWALLPKGCMVVVDDRHGNMLGKHWMVEEFMRAVGAEVVFKNHQMGWLK